MSPKRQAMLTMLAAQPLDAPALARSLGKSMRWTRYWLALLKDLGLMEEVHDGRSHRRLYRLSDAVAVKQDMGRVTFRFPEIDRVCVEIMVNASTLTMPSAARREA